MIVTDKLKDFQSEQMAAFGLDVRRADEFIADTIMLDEGRAVSAMRRMRERLHKPDLAADELLLRMEAVGLTETVDVLRLHIHSLRRLKQVLSPGASPFALRTLPNAPINAP